MSGPKQFERPRVVLKWAETADGFIAREDLSSKWISCEGSRELVHGIRAQVSAVLVGARTALVDNPRLTARPLGVPLPSDTQPLRVVLLPRGSLPPSSALLDSAAPTLIVTSKQNALTRDDSPTTTQPLTDSVVIDFGAAFSSNVLTILWSRGVRSVLIEGGAATLNAFINAALWDEVYIFKSPERFQSGVSAPTISSSVLWEKPGEVIIKTRSIETDTLVHIERFRA